MTSLMNFVIFKGRLISDSAEIHPESRRERNISQYVLESTSTWYLKDISRKGNSKPILFINTDESTVNKNLANEIQHNVKIMYHECTLWETAPNLEQEQRPVCFRASSTLIGTVTSGSQPDPHHLRFLSCELETPVYQLLYLW